jgi:hypothetical protein
MPTPSTLAMDEPEPQMTILPLDEFFELKASLKANYKIGFCDGVIASSAAYIAITLISLFIWSYQ